MPHSAPRAIHCFSVCLSASESRCLGGISCASTRFQSRLLSGLPATMGGPLSPPRKAAGRRVKSSPPWGAAPRWHSRQFVARTTATARAKTGSESTPPCSVECDEVGGCPCGGCGAAINADEVQTTMPVTTVNAGARRVGLRDRPGSTVVGFPRMGTNRRAIEAHRGARWHRPYLNSRGLMWQVVWSHVESETIVDYTICVAPTPE